MRSFSFPCSLPLAGLALLSAAFPASAQISLSAAVNMALKNDPKVKIAQAEVARAQALLSESKDAFVPAVAANGGVGKSTGAPLAPPVVFSIAAQSLVYNSSQRDYIRAAHAGVNSAQLALDAARSDTVEDATNTYITLDNALQRRAVAAQALDFAHHLVTISEDRFAAGVDPHLDLTKSRHTEAEIQLQKLLIDDEIATQSAHLARLIEIPRRALTTDHNSIPVLEPPAPASPDATESAGSQQLIGISAAFAAARAKEYTAHGQRHYLLLPQVAFNAEYSRISTAFSSYTQYYPYYAHTGNSFNSLSLGVEVSVPILDMVHRAKYRESFADAAHSLAEAQEQQLQFLDGRDKLRHSAAELAARTRLASLDRDLAQDQLDAVLIRLRADAGIAGGEQLSPKDEGNARLQERLRSLDMLSADLQLEQTEITLMRQEGSLSGWLAAAIPGAIPATANGSPTPTVPLAPAGAQPGAPNPAGTTPALPPTEGTQPSAPNPAGTTPALPPTEGTSPGSLPSSPVTTPAPSTPQTPSPTTPHP